MFKKFIKDKNKKKVLFTPGPASLSEENIKNLSPAFGRGDSEYQLTEKRVLNLLPSWPVTTSTLTPNPGEESPPWAGGTWGELRPPP